MLKKAITILIAGYILILALVAVLGLTAVVGMNNQRAITNSLYQHPFAVSNAAQEAQVILWQMRDGMLDIALLNDPKGTEEKLLYISELEKNVTKKISIIKSDFLGDIEKVHDVERLLGEWRNVRSREMELIRQGRNDEATKMIESVGVDIFEQINADMDYIIGFARQRAAGFVREADDEGDKNIILAIWMIVVLMAGIGYNAWFVTRRIFVLIRNEERAGKEALLAMSSYNRKLIETSLDPLVTIDHGGKISDVNAATENITGYKRSELVGTDFSGYFTEPEKARVGYQQIFANGAVQNYPLEIKNRDGRITPVLYNASVYRDESGKITGVFAAARDITDLKRNEAEILKLNRLYRMLSDCNQSLIRANDEDGLLTDICNIIINDGRYKAVWVGYAQDDESKTIKPVIYAGDNSCMINTHISWGDNGYGKTPAETAVRTGNISINKNMPDSYSQQGYHSSIAIPLVTNGKIIGALTIYASGHDAFDEGEVKLLHELALDLSFGITTLRARVARRQADQSLRESETRYRLLFEESPIGVTIIGINGDIIDFNTAFLNMFGYSADELKYFKAPALWANPEESSRIIQRLKETGRISNYEAMFKKKNGTAFPVLANSMIIHSAPADLLQIMCIDMTERKHTEEALRESEHFLGTIIENIPDMLFVKEVKNLSFIRFNKAGEKLLGYPREDLIGKNDYDFFPKEQADFFTSKDRDIISSGKLQDISEEIIDTRLLGRRYLHTKKIPVLANDGTPLYLLGISEDITARKQTEDEILRLNEELEEKVKERTSQLEAANSELEAFTYSVSHDLRAPLRVIDGFSKAVEEDYADKVDDTGKDYLHRISAASNKMAGLIDDMLKLSRLTREELSRTNINLSKIAENVITGLREAEPGRNVKITIAPGMEAEGDPNLLEVALTNLLNNAWKYTSKTENPEIEFGSYQENGTTIYYVKDNGAGFDITYSDKLFKPFQRLHTAEEFPGTGIGLATIGRIIHKHGGRVWATGEVGNGAAFYFTLS